MHSTQIDTIKKKIRSINKKAKPSIHLSIRKGNYLVEVHFDQPNGYVRHFEAHSYTSLDDALNALDKMIY